MLMQKIAASAADKSIRLAPQPVHAPASSALADAFALMGASIRFDRNAEIYGEGEASDYVYKVVSGTVRTYKLLSDGRRQIGGFHLKGDVFGLEAATEHRFTAEAIANSVVVVVKKSALVALAARDHDIARDLWGVTAGDLERAQDHLLLLGRKNAQERVATFLLEMAGRGSTEAVVELPMSRQDIADYLGLTIETVSRTLTQLEDEAAIEIPVSRRILLRNRSALNRLNA